MGCGSSSETEEINDIMPTPPIAEKIEELILNNQKFIHNLYSEIIETPAQKMVPINSNAPHKNRK